MTHAHGTERMRIDRVALVDAREQRGLSQRQLAELVGCSNSTIAELERGGRASVPSDIGDRITDALGVAIGQHYTVGLVA